MKKLNFTALLFMGMMMCSYAQERKPAMAKGSAKKSNVQAPGYIKGTPSNYSQDKELKRLSDEEKKAYAPKKKSKATRPKSKKGVVIEQ